MIPPLEDLLNELRQLLDCVQEESETYITNGMASLMAIVHTKVDEIESYYV